MAHVTETVTPFTAVYLNMTPNNVNNSAICQLVEGSKVEMNGKCTSNTIDPLLFKPSLYIFKNNASTTPMITVLTCKLQYNTQKIDNVTIL